jgi:hypothetical protein
LQSLEVSFVQRIFVPDFLNFYNVGTTPWTGLGLSQGVYSRQTMRWSLRGVNILSAVRREYRACRWTEDFLLVSAKVT